MPVNVEDPPPLAALEDVKAEPAAAKLSDARVAQLLATASADFRGDTHQFISRVTDDVIVLDGDGSTVLLLPELPVVDVSAVVVDGTALTADEIKGIWTRRGVLRRRNCKWPWAGQSVQVTYTHGLDPVPADIVDAIVGRVLDRAGKRFGRPVASATTGPLTVTYAPAGGMTEEWARVVARYRVDV